MGRNISTPQDLETKRIISENLNRLLSASNSKKIDVVNQTGITQTSVYNYFSGDALPSKQNLEKLAKFFQVDKAEIDPRFDTSATTDDMNLKVEKVITNTAHRAVLVPVIGTIACGTPILAKQNISGYRYANYDGSSEKVESLFYLKCKGDSMEPTIYDGSLVLINAETEVENGEIAAVLLNNDEEATLKRVKYIDERTILLMPDNPRYEPIILNEKNPGRIIGKAISMSKSLK